MSINDNELCISKSISAGMSDDERYKLLKDRVIDVPYFDAGVLAQINAGDYAALERIGKSGAFKILRKIGEDFGVFKEGYTTQDLDVEFRFSKRNLRESIYLHNQHGNFHNYLKMMTLLSNVTDNAIGIEAHEERYNNPGSRLDLLLVLVSAYYNETNVVPVLLEIKTYTDNTMPSLYVALCLNEIKGSRILGHIPDTNGIKSYPSPTSIKINLTDLLHCVNKNDASLLNTT